MLIRRLFTTLAILATLGISTAHAENKKLLLVTDSGGFVHDSVGLAEEILKEIGPKNGIDVTCYRYTRDLSDKATFEKYADSFRKRTGVAVEPANCGRVNAETLKNFDCVLFFTTGNPLNEQEVKDLVAWVKAGGAVAGTHCGSDTLYPSKQRPWNEGYGELIGAYFDGHPWHQKIKVVVEDPKHAGAAGFKTGDEITDEIYQFRPEPYSRQKLRIIMSVDNSSIDVKKGKRKDNDYAIAWCREVGKGRTFYTSLGHRKEVWKDARYQQHLIGGLKWTMKLAEGSAVPSEKAVSSKPE
ncbi:MAG: ThuA domain-containing protein [Zavarzinella sp.]